MTDTRFKFLVISICITVLGIVGIWRFSNPNLYKSISLKQSDKLGEYVYLDRYSQLHSDRKCSKLKFKGMTSERIPVNDLSKVSYKNICSNCVSDKQYESIIESFSNQIEERAHE